MASHNRPPYIPPAQTPSPPDTIATLPNGITIRPFRQTDIPSLTHHGNNRNIWNNLRNRMPHPYTSQDAESWITLHTDPSNYTPSGHWTLATGSQGPPVPTTYAIAINNVAVGNIGLEFGAPEDIYARTAELGYWLSEEYWGQGIMSLVVPAFVDWTWRTFGILVRLNALTQEWNVGSRKCLEKAGFVVEGVRKWAFMKNGVVGNEVVLGAIRPGYQGL